MPLFNPPCSGCKNYLGSGKCQAYPKVIPKEILEGKDQHRKIRDDQE